jgi:hypothetical protein
MSENTAKRETRPLVAPEAVSPPVDRVARLEMAVAQLTALLHGPIDHPRRGPELYALCTRWQEEQDAQAAAEARDDPHNLKRLRRW